MKILEQILLELDSKNLEASMKILQDQIDYYSNHNMETKGISLLPVRDLVSKQFSEVSLRKQGYILTIEQFKEDCAKFIKLADSDPILYNAYLKRLHRSYQVLQQNYVIGNIKNAGLVGEMKALFSDTLQSFYQGSKNQKMPEKLKNDIEEQLDSEVKQLYMSWHNNKPKKLREDIQTEVTSLLAKQLLADWQKNGLHPSITKNLEMEKNTINSIEVLIEWFRKKQLLANQSKIHSQVIEAIVSDIQAERITGYDDLGATINQITKHSLKKDDVSVVSELILRWQNMQTTPQVSIKLSEYVGKVITKMRQDLDSSLTEEFSQLAVYAFLDKFQQDYLENEELGAAMKEYGLKTANLFLSPNSLPNCRETIYATVMEKLHNDWVTGKFSAEISDFVKESVFSSLSKLDDEIQEKVWPNTTRQGIKQVIGDNAELKKEVSELKEMVLKLEKLMLKMPNIKPESPTVTPREPATLSFFSK
ncbi:MAG: hypothetical protein H0U73_00795 [Tatlockia sp.]|nr:hypothetical protein [Tatlockia sp.]